MSFLPDDLEELTREFDARARRLAFTLGGEVPGLIGWDLPLIMSGRQAGWCFVKSEGDDPREVSVRLALFKEFGVHYLDVLTRLAKNHLLRDMRLGPERTAEVTHGFVWTVTARHPPPGVGAPPPDISLIAAVQGGDLATVSQRLAAGADPNVRNLAGVPVLFAAVAEGHEEIAQTLIEKGADVHAPTANGLVPLVMAASRGNAPMVKLLLASGADVRVGNRDGTTAAHWAVRNGHHDVAELLRHAGA